MGRNILIQRDLVGLHVKRSSVTRQNVVKISSKKTSVNGGNSCAIYVSRYMGGQELKYEQFSELLHPGCFGAVEGRKMRPIPQLALFLVCAVVGLTLLAALGAVAIMVVGPTPPTPFS